MKKTIILCILMIVSQVYGNDNNFIPPSYNITQSINYASYYRNEGFRASSFGAKDIAKYLFHKSCRMGDYLGCVALKNMNKNIDINSITNHKNECLIGDKESCYKLYEYHAKINNNDSYRAIWYLSKSCRLGYQIACAKIKNASNNQGIN